VGVFHDKAGGVAKGRNHDPCPYRPDHRRRHRRPGRSDGVAEGRHRFPTSAITLRSGTGKYLGSAPTAPADGRPSQTLKRADLYRALHEEAARRGVPIEQGKRLVGAKQAGDAVRAVFADGSQATGDLLIGCDGVHSALRRIIDPAAPSPSYAGLVNTGGYAPGVPVDSKAAGPVARSVRDAVLPLILRAAANSKQARQPFDHHIDWNTPVTAATASR
jgi:hypothetical protein